MRTKQKLIFDELNRLEQKPDYFEPMAISVSDKERRRELADLLTDAFLYFFSVYEVHAKYDSLLEKALYEQLLADKVSDAVSKVTGIDSYMSDHIREMSKEVVSTTYKNAPYNPSDSPEKTSDGFLSKSEVDSTERGDQDYWLSYRRAEDIAKTETNTFLNYTDYLDAKDRGYTKKTWLTMLDTKVRNTHEEIEGQTIGIDEFFTVGNSLMKFPHDLSESPDPKEVINCRCAVDYK